MDFSGRHVVVTGGTGALGTAVVGGLIEAGAHCHVPLHRDKPRADFPYAKHGQVSLYPEIDLADEARVTGFYAGIATLWASIHVAGGFAMADISKVSKADLMTMVDTNLVSAFLCCREAVKAMKSGGRIVNVTARPGLEPRTGSGTTAYTVSKAGVAALTVALAQEVVAQGILVNAVAPSTMDTPANRDSMPKADFSKWPKVEEVTATILFLASPDNTVTRGAIVPVYGRS